MSLIYLLLLLPLFWLLGKSANLTTRAIVDMAKLWGLSDLTIGFVILSLATSAPELLVGINSAIKGTPDLSFGNLIGANIALRLNYFNRRLRYISYDCDRQTALLGNGNHPAFYPARCTRTQTLAVVRGRHCRTFDRILFGGFFRDQPFFRLEYRAHNRRIFDFVIRDQSSGNFHYGEKPQHRTQPHRFRKCGGERGRHCFNFGHRFFDQSDHNTRP